MVDFHGVKAKEKPAWQRAFWTIMDVLKKENGGAKGIRTPDLLNAIQALSQLSYSPMPTTSSILYAGLDLVNKKRTFQNHRLRQPNP